MSASPLPRPPMSRADALWTLGLTEAATADEIRSAYRQAARKAHPDAGGSRSDWDRLRSAYEVLMGTAETQAEDLFFWRLAERIQPSIDEGLARFESAAHRKVDQLVTPQSWWGDLFRGAAHKLSSDLTERARAEIQKGLRNAARTTKA